MRVGSFDHKRALYFKRAPVQVLMSVLSLSWLKVCYSALYLVLYPSVT
jgi:hypothetical protein